MDITIRGMNTIIYWLISKWINKLYNLFISESNIEQNTGDKPKYGIKPLQWEVECLQVVKLGCTT